MWWHCIQPSPGQRSPLESIRGLYLACSFQHTVKPISDVPFFQMLILSFMLMTFFFKPVNSEAEALQLQQDVNQIISWIQSRQSLLDATLANLLNETIFSQPPCFPETAKYLGVANFKQFVLVQLIHSKTVKCHLGLIDCRLYLAPSHVRHQIYKTANLPKLYHCSIAWLSSFTTSWVSTKVFWIVLKCSVTAHFPVLF